MAWIIGLLVVIVALLAFIAFIIDSQTAVIADYVRASGQANVRELGQIESRLREIEQHTARVAQAYYEADTERRLHPERYPSENPFA